MSAFLWFLSLIFLLVNSTFAARNPKRGLAFAAGDTPGDLNNANQTKSAISWQYDWGSTPPAYIAFSNIPYIPMQWGSANIENFAQTINAQGAKTILTFNEPDFVNEANMQPEEAARLWKQYIQPLKSSGIRLGGPAITANGKSWLTSFFSACNNCTVDFIPLHWYGEGFEGFYNYLWDIHGSFPGKPIWITEFASTSTNDSAVADFLNQTVTYLDTLEWVERYAWFGFFRPKENIRYNLLDEHGGLNNLGQLYVGAKTVHTQNITQTPTISYKTVDGADRPTQALVTTWPAANSALSRRLNLQGTETRIQAVLVFIALVISLTRL